MLHSQSKSILTDRRCNGDIAHSLNKKPALRRSLIDNRPKLTLQTQFWKQIFQLVREKDVYYNASAITFNLILCGVPFGLLLASIMGFVLSDDRALEEIIRYSQEFLPSFFLEDSERASFTVKAVLAPLVSNRGVTGITGIVFLSLSSLGLVGVVKHAMFEIFDFQDRKSPVWEWVYNFFSFGIAGGIFIFFTLFLSFLSLIAIQSVTIPFIDYQIKLGWLFETLTVIAPILFTFYLFYSFYRWVSERRISRRVSLFGALVFTTMFELAKIGFGLFLDFSFNRYQDVYQGYTFVVFLLFWALYGALLFVVATIAARAFQDVYINRDAEESDDSPTASESLPETTVSSET